MLNQRIPQIFTLILEYHLRSGILLNTEKPRIANIQGLSTQILTTIVVLKS